MKAHHAPVLRNVVDDDGEEVAVSVRPRGELVLSLPPRPAWFADAACRGMDPELFFAVGPDSTQPARQVCAMCTVLYQCEEYALDQGDWLVGIFAGASQSGRKHRRTWIEKRREVAA